MSAFPLYPPVRYALILVIITVAGSSGFAQPEPPAAPPAPAKLVTLNVIVTDRADQAVEDVRKEDLLVTDSGAAQTLTHFARDERPVSCGFLIDASGSVRRILNYLIDSARLAAEGLKPGDEAFVARFVGPEQFQIKEPMTSDLESVADAIDSIFVEGGQTAVHDAIDKALKYLEENRSGDTQARRSVLVLVTDGEDRASKIRDSKEILARARQSNVQIFVLGLTKFSGLQSSASKATSLLTDLADQSGGRAFFPAAASGLPDAGRELARELRMQFTIGYPANSTGGERKVQVKWVGQDEKRKVLFRPVISVP